MVPILSTTITKVSYYIIVLLYINNTNLTFHNRGNKIAQDIVLRAQYSTKGLNT